MDHEHEHGVDSNGCSYHHAMAFHVSVCQELLFPGWLTSSGLEVFGSAVVLFIAGVLYEGFKYWRETLHADALRATKESQENITKRECGGRSAPGPKYSMLSSTHLVQTLLYIIQTTVSYILMLVFMTYQVYLCLGLVLGMGCGYFLFGWKKSNALDVDDHCG